MNIEQARFNMVEQQIRPWEVLDPAVLSLLSTLKREAFVPAAYEALAFADVELPLGHGQKMWAPKMEARVVQDLKLTGNESILEIGTGSGYLTALLAARAKHVTSIERDPVFAAQAQRNLATAGIYNADVIVADGLKGYPAAAPYDVVVFTGSMEVMLDAAFEWIKPTGRIFAVIGKAPAMQARVMTRTPEGSVLTQVLFETVLDPLIGAPQAKAFVF